MDSKLPTPSGIPSLISVIIPTTCEASRSALLHRAISSVEGQTGVQTEILVVCNGDRQDLRLLESLKKNTRLQILLLKEGNVSKARYQGLRNASGEFFCFLDDDDEFLPEGLLQRIEIMRRDLECDVVVTNGLIHVSGTDAPLVCLEAALTINSDPCISFLRQNWFASPASLFRTARIRADLFDFQYKYFEWTYLFFLLVSVQRRIVFYNFFTYRKYEDNPLSISKSIEYSLAYPGFLLCLNNLALPKPVKTAIRKKYVTALNTQSNIYREQGQWLEAWGSHLTCLAHGGLRYIPYTRHLLFPFAR